jgi:hypothetical protein
MVTEWSMRKRAGERLHSLIRGIKITRMFAVLTSLRKEQAMSDTPSLDELIKAAEEREAARKKAQHGDDPAWREQVVIQLRERVAAVLAQEVRDVLQFTYEWDQAQRRPHAVFRVEHPTQGSITCDLIELEVPGAWRVWTPNPYHRALTFTTAEFNDGLLLAIGSFQRLEF